MSGKHCLSLRPKDQLIISAFSVEGLGKMDIGMFFREQKNFKPNSERMELLTTTNLHLELVGWGIF